MGFFTQGTVFFFLLTAGIYRTCLVSGHDGDACAYEYGNASTSEIEFLWPQSCDRSHVLGHVNLSSSRCNETMESGNPGYDRILYDGPHMCFRRDPWNVTMFDRVSLRKTPLFTPKGLSACKMMSAVLKGRLLVMIGDSVTGQLSRFLALRCGDHTGWLKKVGPVYKIRIMHIEYPSRVGPLGHLPKEIQFAPLAPTGPKGANSQANWAKWHQDFGNWTKHDLEAESVMYVNLGLHYLDSPTNRVLLRQGLAHWALAVRTALDKGRLGAAVFAETTAQHFDTADGGFEHRRAGDDPVPHIPSYPCVPRASDLGCNARLRYLENGTLDPTGNSGDSAARVGWRSEILHEEAARVSIPWRASANVPRRYGTSTSVSVHRRANRDTNPMEAASSTAPTFAILPL
mmetsp:Transcript_15495/g.36160  ORF Transcript_15495/g.36160 Transcript_15495/m.36160 type:complete len:401 (-) Transcript_15495:468-1670(-)